MNPIIEDRILANLPKLGKRQARHDPRTLIAARYMGALPPPPAAVNYLPSSLAITLGGYGMMENNQLGDCTCAGMGHAVQIATAQGGAGSMITVPDADILLAYEQACDYDPTNPATDEGGDELTVLTYWRNHGIGSAGHKIAAFAGVGVLNHPEVMQALDLFGFLYIGVQLPSSAQPQTGVQGLWDVDNTPAGNPGTWGGHCVVIGQADATGLTCITWGATQRMTWAFWDRYVDECYACLTPDWIEANGKAPSGFDLPTLQADLAVVTA